MNDNQILEFLTGLRENNSRDWLLAHRDLQREASAQFEQLLQDIIAILAQKDKRLLYFKPKDFIFRLNKDTRFSHDKSPYNPSFRAHLSAGGRAPIPVGCFLHIAPGNLFLGGGLFASRLTDATARIRSYIAEHGTEFESILKEPSFREHFSLIGEKLKNVPRGFDSSHPQSEYLKYKSWAVECHLEDSVLMDLSAFSRRAAELFLLMHPFNDYLNRALEGFRMPEHR